MTYTLEDLKIMTSKQDIYNKRLNLRCRAPLNFYKQDT